MKTTHAAIAIAATLVVGVASGAAAASTPTIQAPHECRAMADTAEQIFDLWTDLAGAVNDRGDALDKDTYAIHDAEVNHVLASLDAVEVEYIDAENACLGDS